MPPVTGTVTAFWATKIVTTGPSEVALDYLGGRPRQVARMVGSVWLR